jgi:hypothetical protein
VNEVQIEVHSKNGLLDFVLVHARSGDHVLADVDAPKCVLADYLDKRQTHRAGADNESLCIQTTISR